MSSEWFDSIEPSLITSGEGPLCAKARCTLCFPLKGVVENVRYD